MAPTIVAICANNSREFVKKDNKWNKKISIGTRSGDLISSKLMCNERMMGYVHK